MATTTPVGDFKENASLIDYNAPQPQIHIEERTLKLKDFLKTVIKVGGSDLHLQASSVPMIRVDGRPRFLDCQPMTDEQMEEVCKELAQNKPDLLATLEHKGAVDCAYAMPDK